MEREEAYKIAQHCAQILKERFDVQNVYIFGSVAGDGIWHKRSDIDIAVEGLPSDKYFKALVDIGSLLPLGLDMDLITLEDAPIKMVERIKEINKNGNEKMSENKIAGLRRQIDIEFENMEKAVYELDEFLQEICGQKPSRMEIGGVGSYLQNFYNGAEKIFERIAIAIDGDIPDGENWHIMLLEQMGKEMTNRPIVIEPDLVLKLLDYLRFRHLFRHIYGGELDWNRIYPLVIVVSDIFNRLKEQVTHFLDQIHE